MPDIGVFCLLSNIYQFKARFFSTVRIMLVTYSYGLSQTLVKVFTVSFRVTHYYTSLVKEIKRMKIKLSYYQIHLFELYQANSLLPLQHLYSTHLVILPRIKYLFTFKYKFLMTSGERIIWNIFFDLKELYYRTFLNVDVTQLVGYLASMHKTLSSNLIAIQYHLQWQVSLILVLKRLMEEFRSSRSQLYMQ